MGDKRAKAMGDGTILTVCCDCDRHKAEQIRQLYPGARIEEGWQALVRRNDVDAVFVCTSNDVAPAIALAAVSEGKHVFLEKPGARRAAELDGVDELAERTGVCVRVGFNHRYHRAVREARSVFEAGAIGDLLFVRGRYGHGGRTGYEGEWRADPARAGGGEALDQGVHLLDLARWFLGDLKLIGGKAATYFWNMPVEDNAFFLLESSAGRIAQLHVSWTEWKNLFSFEIMGRLGKLEIAGLGGSYGVERLTHYQMQPEMGPPATTIYEYPMADDSWSMELKEFAEDIRLRRKPQPGIAEAQGALRLVEDLYR